MGEAATFECPECGKKLRVPEDDDEIRCPRCREWVEVPLSLGDDEEDDRPARPRREEDDEEDDRPSRRRPRGGGGGDPGWVVWGGRLMWVLAPTTALLTLLTAQGAFTSLATDYSPPPSAEASGWVSCAGTVKAGRSGRMAVNFSGKYRFEIHDRDRTVKGEGMDARDIDFHLHDPELATRAWPVVLAGVFAFAAAAAHILGRQSRTPALQTAAGWTLAAGACIGLFLLPVVGLLLRPKTIPTYEMEFDTVRFANGVARLNTSTPNWIGFGAAALAVLVVGCILAGWLGQARRNGRDT